MFASPRNTEGSEGVRRIVGGPYLSTRGGNGVKVKLDKEVRGGQVEDTSPYTDLNPSKTVPRTEPMDLPFYLHPHPD